MLVRFTKNPPAAAFDLLQCEPGREPDRASSSPIASHRPTTRSRTWTSAERAQDTPAYALPREAVLPRAAIQLVVETVLGWSDGYFDQLGASTSGAAQHSARNTAAAASRRAESPRAASAPAESSTAPLRATLPQPQPSPPPLPLPAPTSPRARQSGAIAACLQAEQWSGPGSLDGFKSSLHEQCRASAVATPELSAAQLAALRTELRAFGAAWRPLAPGQSLEREFPRP